MTNSHWRRGFFNQVIIFIVLGRVIIFEAIRVTAINYTHYCIEINIVFKYCWTQYKRKLEIVSFVQMHKAKTNRYIYFVVHSELMVQSLLSNEKKPDIYDLGVADGIKEMLAVHGFTKGKILNTTVSKLAETLHIDYYVALIIYNSAKEV